jgi:predicted molibdopterin-dependent oxidoreductase YjgC
MSGFEVRVDGVAVTAYDDDTVASLLVREGCVSWRRTRFGDRPRGLFCGMGACQDCLVAVDGVEGVRACLTPVQPGMAVTTSEADRG